MPNRTVAAFIAISAAAAPLAAQQAPVDDPVVGCYRLELGEWGPPDHPQYRYPMNPPAEFRLHGEVDPDVRDRRRELNRVTPKLDPTSALSIAHWERTGADSVRVGWSTGFSGVSVYLAGEGVSLWGTARRWTDVILIDDDGVPVPLLAAKVVAQRVPCVGEDS